MKLLKLSLLFLALGILQISCKEATDKPKKEIQKTQVTNAKADVFAKDVDANNFKNLLDSKAGLLIDVRTPKEFEGGHIPGAINIDWRNQDEFAAKIAEISKDKTVLIYCHSGHRSGNAKKYLQEHGYQKIYNLETGIMGWKEAELPIEK
jgi:rhodanese-related sulfurtransferase